MIRYVVGWFSTSTSYLQVLGVDPRRGGLKGCRPQQSDEMVERRVEIQAHLGVLNELEVELGLKGAPTSPVGTGRLRGERA